MLRKTGSGSCTGDQRDHVARSGLVGRCEGVSNTGLYQRVAFRAGKIEASLTIGNTCNVELTRI
jgi:hypothetical protein